MDFLTCCVRAVQEADELPETILGTAQLNHVVPKLAKRIPSTQVCDRLPVFPFPAYLLVGFPPCTLLAKMLLAAY